MSRVSKPASPAIKARNHLWATFLVMGISSMAWVPRIPEIKEQLALRDGAFGLVFLSGALGSVLGTQISGRAIHLIASKSFARICAVLMPIGVYVIGSAHSVFILVIGLFIAGLSFSALDVAANVQAMAIEKLAKARYMSSFHAMWSIGAFIVTFFGGAIAKYVTPQTHLKTLAVISLLLYVFTLNGLLPGDMDGHQGEVHEVTKAKIPFFAREALPLWALGIGLMASFLPEAGIYDWSGILLKDHMGIGKGVTAIAATCYSLGMIASRFLGDKWFEKWGHQRTVKYGGYIGGSAIAIGLAFGISLANINKFAAVTLLSAGFTVAGLCMGPLFPAFNLAAMSVPGVAPSVGMARVSLIAIASNFFGPALIGGISEVTSLPVSFVLLALLLLLVGRQSKYISVKEIK